MLIVCNRTADDTNKCDSTVAGAQTALFTMYTSDGQMLAVITFSVRRSRGEMCIGHGCLCVCLSLAAFPHYCTDPDVSWGNGRGAL